MSRRKNDTKSLPSTSENCENIGIQLLGTPSELCNSCKKNFVEDLITANNSTTSCQQRSPDSSAEIPDEMFSCKGCTSVQDKKLKHTTAVRNDNDNMNLAPVDHNLPTSVWMKFKDFMPYFNFGQSQNWRLRNWVTGFISRKKLAVLTRHAFGILIVTTLILLGATCFKYQEDLENLHFHIKHLEKRVNEWHMRREKELDSHWEQIERELDQRMVRRVRSILNTIQRPQCEAIADNCGWDIAAAIPNSLFRKLTWGKSGRN